MPEFVKTEFRFIAPRVCICGAAAFLISGIVWKWDLSFALGLIFGIICVLANFLVMGIVSYKATMRGARGAKTAKAVMSISYVIRVVALGLCLYLCYIIPWLNPIAFFVTPIFVNIVYLIDSIIYKNGR
jgi:hypothetical protein